MKTLAPTPCELWVIQSESDVDHGGLAYWGPYADEASAMEMARTCECPVLVWVPKPFLAREAAAERARKWIDCPLCGSTDTRCDPEGEDGWIINCVNLECPSNKPLKEIA